ncbi:hypothetical protein ACFLY6_02045 [Candidatus Dependentiae bacterium]
MKKFNMFVAVCCLLGTSVTDLQCMEVKEDDVRCLGGPLSESELGKIIYGSVTEGFSADINLRYVKTGDERVPIGFDCAYVWKETFSSEEHILPFLDGKMYKEVDSPEDEMRFVFIPDLKICVPRCLYVKKQVKINRVGYSLDLDIEEPFNIIIISQEGGGEKRYFRATGIVHNGELWRQMEGRGSFSLSKLLRLSEISSISFEEASGRFVLKDQNGVIVYYLCLDNKGIVSSVEFEYENLGWFCTGVSKMLKREVYTDIFWKDLKLILKEKGFVLVRDRDSVEGEVCICHKDMFDNYIKETSKLCGSKKRARYEILEEGSHCSVDEHKNLTLLDNFSRPTILLAIGSGVVAAQAGIRLLLEKSQAKKKGLKKQALAGCAVMVVALAGRLAGHFECIPGFLDNPLTDMFS